MEGNCLIEMLNVKITVNVKLNIYSFILSVNREGVEYSRGE